MPDVSDAVKLVTDPANVHRMGPKGPQEQFSVNSKRVIRALRDQGAGKAEARELALDALTEVGGGAEIHPSRGKQGGQRGDPNVEEWWVPAEKVRF